MGASVEDETPTSIGATVDGRLMSDCEGSGKTFCALTERMRGVGALRAWPMYAGASTLPALAAFGSVFTPLKARPLALFLRDEGCWNAPLSIEGDCELDEPFGERLDRLLRPRRCARLAWLHVLPCAEIEVPEELLLPCPAFPFVSAKEVSVAVASELSKEVSFRSWLASIALMSRVSAGEMPPSSAMPALSSGGIEISMGAARRSARIVPAFDDMPRGTLAPKRKGVVPLPSKLPLSTEERSVVVAGCNIALDCVGVAFAVVWKSVGREVAGLGWNSAGRAVVGV